MFTVTPEAGAELCEFRPYYSANGTVNTSATYIYEWEWMAEEDTSVKLAGAYSASGKVMYNGTPHRGPNGGQIDLKIDLSAGVWQKEQVVITNPHASDYVRWVFTPESCSVSLKSFKTTVITGNESYDGISIGSVADMEIGETATMSVTGTKNGAVVSAVANSKLSFESSNNAVVSVNDDGVLTANKAGKADITVTYADYGISKTAEVTVLPGVPSVDVSSHVVDAGEMKGEDGTVFAHSYVVYATITNYQNIINYGMTLRLADGTDAYVLPSHFDDAAIAEALEKSNGQFAFKVFGSVIDDKKCTLTPYITTSSGTVDGNTSKQFGQGTIEE